MLVKEKKVYVKNIKGLIKEMSLEQKGDFFNGMIEEFIKIRKSYFDLRTLLQYFERLYNIDVFTIRKALKSVRSQYVNDDAVIGYIQNKPYKRTALERQAFFACQKIRKKIMSSGKFEEEDIRNFLNKSYRVQI